MRVKNGLASDESKINTGNCCDVHFGTASSRKWKRQDCIQDEQELVASERCENLAVAYQVKLSDSDNPSLDSAPQRTQYTNHCWLLIYIH